MIGWIQTIGEKLVKLLESEDCGWDFGKSRAK